MVYLRVPASKMDFEKWQARVQWTPEAGGVRRNRHTGARTAWIDGAAWVRLGDDKPHVIQNTTMLLEKQFASAATTTPTPPPEVARVLGDPPPASSEKIVEVETVTDDGEEGVETVEQVTTDDEAGEDAATTARAAVEAATVGGEIDQAIAGAAEEAREAIATARTRRRQAVAESASGYVPPEEERKTIERLRGMGIDVGEEPIPTSGFVVNMSIISKTSLTRVIHKTPYTTKLFKKLGGKEDIIEYARRRARRHIEREGGTPFMEGHLVPHARLSALLETLKKLQEDFYATVEKEIGGERERINDEIRDAIRKHENREAREKDLIPEDVSSVFEYRFGPRFVKVPGLQELLDAEVALDTAQGVIDNVVKTSREIAEKAILRRFAVAYKSLSAAWETVSQGKTINRLSRAYLKDVVKEIEKADTTKNVVVRAELERLRALAEFVLETAEAGELKKAKAALAKAVDRVVAIHNATTPLTGAQEVAPQQVATVEDGLRVITEQLALGMESNEDRYGASVEPDPKDPGKINIRHLRHDGTPESVRKAFLAYSQQFERLVVKG